MSNEIINTDDLIEDEEDSEIQNDLTATHEAEGKGIEFHVSMRHHTLRDMEELIVAAAAQMLVGKYDRSALAKKVEERAIAVITQKADEAVAKIAVDILDQPITPKYTYSKPDAQPITMRELIGLTGREYLTAQVESDGKPATGSSYRSKARIQHIVETMMSRKFDDEIKSATYATVREIEAAVKAKHEATLTAEKTRIREALARITGETA
jgi:hypothetical protein